jgi:hypothetical protein
MRSWIILLTLAACTREVASPSDLAIEATNDLSPENDLAPGFVTAAHPPLPQPTNHNSKELTSLRLVSVVSSGDPLQQTLFDFGDALVTSGWWSTVGADYGLGPAASSMHLTGPAIASGTNMSGADIKSYLQALATGAASGDGHSIYVLYLPENVGILGNQNKVVSGCDGFHFANFDAQGDVWAVIKRCDKTGATATYLASH